MPKMRLLKLLVVLLTCAAAVPAIAGPFEDGMAAYNRGDYATALRLFRPLADTGDPSAQGAACNKSEKKPYSARARN
jgi:hypothetical protein